MKPEEAIKILEVAKAECEWNAPLEYQAAFDAAFDALEKQIPKKPQAPMDAYWTCPTCGRKVNYPFEYCVSCGQKICWEEEG